MSRYMAHCVAQPCNMAHVNEFPEPEPSPLAGMAAGVSTALIDFDVWLRTFRADLTREHQRQPFNLRHSHRHDCYACAEDQDACPETEIEPDLVPANV